MSNMIYNVRKKCFYLLSILGFILALSSCQSVQKESSDSKEDGSFILYYFNAEENGLVKIEKKLELSTNPETAIRQVLDELSQVDTSQATPYKAVINEQITYDSIEVSENEEAHVDFGAGYSQMNRTREILFRAAIVKSLVQVDGVSKVSFTVNQQPLIADNGSPVGWMGRDTFIMDDDREKVYDSAETVSLFYANQDGDGLIESLVFLEAKNNQSMEEAVLEALKRNSQENSKSPLPDQLIFKRISVIQGICYVDLNDDIYTVIPGVDEEIKIYSMVNTLTSLSRVSAVQFTINGELLETMNDVAGFDGLLEKDMSLVVTQE